MWQNEDTLIWAHTLSVHWSALTAPWKERRKKNKREKEQHKKGGQERTRVGSRRSGGCLSQQILKVSVIREGFCLQRVFYFLFFSVVLYLSVSPSVLLLVVWERGENGRVLSSQDFSSFWDSLQVDCGLRKSKELRWTNLTSCVRQVRVNRNSEGQTSKLYSVDLNLSKTVSIWKQKHSQK